MKRIMITGASGILGRHVVSCLRLRLPDAELITFKGDLTEPDNVHRQVGSLTDLDALIHLAAIVPVRKVEQDPARAYSVNAGGTIQLLGAVVEAGLRPFVFHCSTGHVYAPSGEPLNESAPTAPHSLYGRTKWMGETAAMDICTAAPIPLCVGRLFSIHDPAQTGDYLRPTMERRLKTENLDEPFHLHGADSVRDFLPASHAAELIVRLCLARAEGIVNIGSGNGTRIRDFVQSLSERPLNIVPRGQPNQLVADVSLMRQKLVSCP